MSLMIWSEVFNLIHAVIKNVWLKEIFVLFMQDEWLIVVDIFELRMVAVI